MRYAKNDNKCLRFAMGSFFQSAEVHWGNAEVRCYHVLWHTVMNIGENLCDRCVSLGRGERVEVFDAMILVNVVVLCYQPA